MPCFSEWMGEELCALIDNDVCGTRILKQRMK